MSGYSAVQMLGNLTRDPEVRYTQDNMAIVNFNVAVNRKVKKGDDWVDEVSFIGCTMLGNRGQAFAKYHSKGQQVFVHGELRQDSWDDKNGGGKRTKTYVFVNGFEFVGGKREGAPRENAPARQDAAFQPGPDERDFQDADSTPF